MRYGQKLIRRLIQLLASAISRRRLRGCPPVRLHGSMSSLSASEYRAVVLFYFLGRPLKEIASLLRISDTQGRQTALHGAIEDAPLSTAVVAE
jgi:hypothetical protein